MKRRAPSFPRSLRKGWETAKADAFLAPRPLVSLFPCSLGPLFPWSLFQSTFPTLARLTLRVRPLIHQKRAHVHFHPASHVGIHPGCAAPRVACRHFFESASRNSGRLFPIWQQLLARVPDTCLREPWATPRRMMVLSPSRPMIAIRSGPVPVFLTRTATLLPFESRSQERLQDQPQ